MRLLAYTSASLVLLVAGLWLLAQFRDIGIRTANTDRQITLKTQPGGIVLERLHPYPSRETLRLRVEPAGMLKPNFVGFAGPQRYEPMPGVQYVIVNGGIGHLLPVSAVPTHFLNVFAVSWVAVGAGGRHRRRAAMVALPFATAQSRQWLPAHSTASIVTFTRCAR